MKNYFVTYDDDNSERHCVHFWDDKGFWAWLQKWKDEKGSLPKSMAVYIGECIFDGS